MTLSARNQLKGTVEEIQLGGVMAHVVVRALVRTSSKA
jgi:molybdopterin-binding protein